MSDSMPKINDVHTPKTKKKSKKKNSYKSFLNSYMKERKDVFNVSKKEKDLHAAKIEQSLGGGNFKKIDKI